MAKKIDEETISTPDSRVNEHRNGAIPRNPAVSRADAARRRRRRLDSLNLETNNHRTNSSVYDGSENPGILDIIMDPFRQTQNSDNTNPQETALEGQELYLHFFHERLRGEGLNGRNAEEGLDEYHDPALHRSDENDGSQCVSTRIRRQSMNLQNFQNPVWRQAGRELNALAARFARSEERDIVRCRAEQVNVNSLDYNKFIALLKELFPNGEITRERILVLFFFCSDVAILALRNKLEGMLGKLTSWTLRFIREQVCDWVQRNGGWRHVLSTSLNVVQQMAIVGMCAAVITACFVYAKKNLR